MLLRVGAFVRTSYNTGPYTVLSLSGPCTCPGYVRSLNGDNRPSRPHWHMEVADLKGKRDFYLGGYALDGRSVWCEDRLIDASQLELF
ncbi:conserved hypothetical protein [Paraburkholderia caribensis]|nr:conserved hypothetical protein [Paraburkholderia caribensis]